jgi:hypothetical protein
MAAGDSIVGICNLALVQGLGQDPISALSDNRKAAILCNLNYDPVRRELLRKHIWNFATARAQLSASATPPAFGFANAFTLPADFIRLVPAVGEDSNQEKWKIEGRQLLSDDDGALDLVYIYDCQDPTLFDPLFVQALGYALAAELAIPITQDKALRARMEKSEEKLGMRAKVSSQDNSAQEWDNDVLLRSRD